MAKEKAKAARAKEKACGGCRYLRLTTGARAKVCITFYCRFFQWAHWVLFFARLPARCFSYNIIFLLQEKEKGKGKEAAPSVRLTSTQNWRRILLVRLVETAQRAAQAVGVMQQPRRWPRLQGQRRWCLWEKARVGKAKAKGRAKVAQRPRIRRFGSVL